MSKAFTREDYPLTQANIRASYVARNGDPTLNVIATVLTVAAYAVLLYRLNAYFDWYTTVRYPYWLVGRWMIPILSGTAFVLWFWSNSYVDHQRLRMPENSTDRWIIWVVLATILIFVVSLIYLIVYEIVTNWTSIIGG